jgi:lysine 2,3-aminomutase
MFSILPGKKMIKYFGTSEKFSRCIPKTIWSNVSMSKWKNWKWQNKNGINSPTELRKVFPGLHVENKSCFPMRISPYYASLIDSTNMSCPIRIQAIPSPLELESSSDEDDDPLKEESQMPVPGLTHRYPDRVLMYVSNSCAMYCRHCTRKRKVGSAEHSTVHLSEAMNYLRKHTEVRDVILSGGDPLLLSSKRLDEILSSLRSLKSIEMIRIGSRVPVTLPMRIDDELCSVLKKYPPIYLNTHFNHPKECTRDAYDAINSLLNAGCVVSNQMVLLKGINDSVPIVRRLNQLLLMMRVRPYYIFQCDKVPGTKHFHTPISKGIEIIEGLRGWTSGLAVPHFVIDSSEGKIPLIPNYVVSHTGGMYVLRNYRGKKFNVKE